MAIRAKFKVQSVQDNVGRASNGTDKKYTEIVRMSPVFSSDPNHENRAFWDATPSGDLSMWINNPKAWGTFKAGQEFYVDFTEAD